MATRKLQTVSAALVAEIVATRCPAMADAYKSVTEAARIQSKAQDAATQASETRKAEGLDDENLFAKIKRAGIEAAAAKLPGGSVMGFWEYQNSQNGLKDNTGRSYARLAGYISDAVQSKEYTAEEIAAATRPELQTMFASGEAKARTAVRVKAGEMAKGATEDYCHQLLAYLDAFRYKAAIEGEKATATELAEQASEERQVA